MSNIISIETKLRMSNPTPSPRGPLATWLHKDNNVVGLWLTEPRASLAYAVSGLGQRVMRLAGRIHPDPISDVSGAMSEEFDAGYRAGKRAGFQRVMDLALTLPAGQVYLAGVEQGRREALGEASE